MEQYIQRVEKLGIDIKTREKRSGFSKGPSKMVDLLEYHKFNKKT
jgi:hypothetical protein